MAAGAGQGAPDRRDPGRQDRRGARAPGEAGRHARHRPEEHGIIILANVPESLVVFAYQGDRYVLQFDPGSEGRIQGPQGAANLLLRARLAGRREAGRQVLLGPGERGPARQARRRRGDAALAVRRAARRGPEAGPAERGEGRPLRAKAWTGFSVVLVVSFAAHPASTSPSRTRSSRRGHARGDPGPLRRGPHPRPHAEASGEEEEKKAEVAAQQKQESRKRRSRRTRSRSAQKKAARAARSPRRSSRRHPEGARRGRPGHRQRRRRRRLRLRRRDGDVASALSGAAASPSRPTPARAAGARAAARAAPRPSATSRRAAAARSASARRPR